MNILSLNREPSLIICVNNTKLQETVINLVESTNFSSVYLSTYAELLDDLQSKNSTYPDPCLTSTRPLSLVNSGSKNKQS